MREVNFSIPNANKASVGITTALYDRRALDCTSTLPLINSLNHLAYLTTSSARIRDILTVDGGVERLVCILKEGRSKDVMDMWKWNLAFQCVVNIGVRGSENVRTRVVEADMVPVIATILDNYVKVIDKCREKAESDLKRSSARLGQSGRHTSRSGDLSNSATGQRTDRSRRHVPPPIEIPGPLDQALLDFQGQPTLNTPAITHGSPPPHFSLPRPQHRHLEPINPFLNAGVDPGRREGGQAAGTAPLVRGHNVFGLRPIRDVDRLPSTLPTLQSELTSQPGSPTTPNAPIQLRQGSPRIEAADAGDRRRRRPSMRHQLSMSGDSDDGQNDDIASDGFTNTAPPAEPIVGIQNEIHMPDMDNDEMLDAGATPVGLAAPPSDANDAETFNITHRSAIDGSIINPVPPATPGPIGFSPVLPNVNAVNAVPQTMTTLFPRYVNDRNSTVGVIPAMPRDEDVLMSLQLLAYVSKYCILRSYFQKSHLVPRLKVGSELQLIDGDIPTNDMSQQEEDSDDEYLVPDDFNIFPLVEKFTVRHHSQDMQYWAGVVMRNLCRKDDARGGIRQCAYYQCGRWEEYTRQFAKCRRCRRTKYCSKECQKSAWVYHRHWCVAAQQ